MRAHFKTALVIVLSWALMQYSVVWSRPQQSSTGWISGSGTPSGSCSNGVLYVDYTGGVLWFCVGGQWVNPVAAATVPSGFTGMVVSGACPSGYSEASALDGIEPLGTLAAHGNIGTTGGSDSITPTIASLTAAAQAFTGTAGTVPAETFTGSSATTSAVSAGTPAGTNSAPTFTGNLVTAVSTSSGTKLVTANTSSGVSPQTTATGTVSAPTFTGSALATHTHTLTATGTNGTAAFTPAGTVAWPAGVPTVTADTFSGSALGTHTHTLTATGSNGTVPFTPAGTNGASAVSGTLNSFDNHSAFVRVIFCSKV